MEKLYTQQQVIILVSKLVTEIKDGSKSHFNAEFLVKEYIRFEEVDHKNNCRKERSEINKHFEDDGAYAE